MTLKKKFFLHRVFVMPFDTFGFSFAADDAHDTVACYIFVYYLCFSNFDVILVELRGGLNWVSPHWRPRYQMQRPAAVYIWCTLDFTNLKCSWHVFSALDMFSWHFSAVFHRRVTDQRPNSFSMSTSLLDHSPKNMRDDADAPTCFLM